MNDDDAAAATAQLASTGQGTQQLSKPATKAIILLLRRSSSTSAYKHCGDMAACMESVLVLKEFVDNIQGPSASVVLYIPHPSLRFSKPIRPL